MQVDERVVRVLTAFDVAGDAQGLAARGARYCLPGWRTEQPRKNGSVKVSYPSGRELADKVTEFLAGAQNASDVAGRCLCLLVLALLANEDDAVAMSNRSHYALRAGRQVPWGGDAIRLLEQIAIERLPEQLIAHLRERHQRTTEALAILDAALQDPGTLDDEQAAETMHAANTVYGNYAPEAWQVRETITAARALAQQAGEAAETVDGADQAPPSAHADDATPESATPSEAVPSTDSGDTPAHA